MQRSVRQTERRIPAAAVAVEERQGREEQSRTAAVGVQYRVYIQEVPVPSHGRWCRRLSERSPQEQGTAWKGEGIKVEAHARCMAAATNDRSAGWLQRAWHTSQHLVFPAQFASSLGRAAPRPCSRWPSALEDPCCVWSWDELWGGTQIGREGRRVTWFGSE